MLKIALFRLLLVGLTLAASLRPALSADLSVGRDCTGPLNDFMSDKDSASETQKLAALYCAGVVAGNIESLQITGNVCAPSMPKTKGIGLVLQYMEAHPEKLDEPISYLVTDAALSLWKCPATDSNVTAPPPRSAYIPPPVQLPRAPSITNCSRIGNSITCMSN